MAQSTHGAPGWRENRAARIARQTRERTARKHERRSPRDDAPERESSKKEAPARSNKPRIGFLRASAIERAFILLIYATVAGLVFVSIVGTFYGSHGANAPITEPMLIWATIQASGSAIYWAIGVQGVLSLCQYGARQLARHDGRWWLLYLAALGISVYFNIQAYFTPLLAYMLPGYAYALIVAFDALPEFIAIRHDQEFGMVQLYLLCGTIMTLGFVWFWIVRPIVVALGAAYADWRSTHADQPRHARPARRRPALNMRVMSRPIVRTAARTTPEREPARSDDFPLLNGVEPQLSGSVNPSALALNATEVIAVGRMIDHNRSAAKPSKSSTIAAGFGVSRGGSAAYIRASAIYDALFGAPTPAATYRPLTPEQEKVRAQLMKQKAS